MYSEFATDQKVQMMSEVYQRRLVMLFCLRCNDNVTLQDEEVTFLLRLSNDEWQQTKEVFIAKGFINSDNEILNWDKRQFKSDTSKNRVNAYRERKKQTSNNDVTLQQRKCNALDTDTDTDTDIYAKDKSRKTTLPKDFFTSQRVIDWAKKNNHFDLDKHLENFVIVCQKQNYKYVDWDSAFMDAIRKNWADVKAKKPNGVVI